MSIFKSKEGGILDAIRCDEKEYLIWKWRPSADGSRTNKENAIRCGSSISVKDGQAAVFIHSGVSDIIYGPYTGRLSTDNMPVTAGLIGAAFAGGTPFPAEVYFVDLSKVIQIHFGIGFFDVFDAVMKDFSIPVSVRGTLTFQIKDCQEFIRIYGLNELDINSLSSRIESVVKRYIKTAVSNCPVEYGISVVHIESKLNEINIRCEADLRERLYTDFGIYLSGLDIEAIEPDRSSNDYRQFIMMTKEREIAVSQTKLHSQISDIQDAQRMDSEDAADRKRRIREEEQYERHLKTQSQYKDIHMVNIGAAPHVSTPPPVPVTLFHIAENGGSTGPYDINAMKLLAFEGRLCADTLVWKNGLTEWVRADSVFELKDIFVSPPKLPK